MRSLLSSTVALACVSALAVGISGTTQAAPKPDKRAQAVAHAKASAPARAGVGAGQKLVVRDVILDADGASHVRFDRTYRGLPVVGGDFVIHQGKSGTYKALSGRVLRPMSLNARPRITAPRAAATAGSKVRFAKEMAKPELVVLATRRTPALTWRVNVTGRRADGSPAGVYYFVDARSGKVLAHWASELNETGSGNGILVGTVPVDTRLSGSSYQMIDPVRGNNETHNGSYASGAPVFTDADNVWGNGLTSNTQSAGVDAHYGIAATWDFYKVTFGRNGIANNGVGARSYVHDGAYANASWSDTCFCMKYGDGDATTYPLASLDVAGHEMTHGVTSRTARLIYSGESGGLNEATSDIFGTMVEFYANNSVDVPDYVIGEKIFRSYNPATNYIRRMDNPALDGASHSCWTTRTRRVNVHYSSGPANHFFYLLSEGSGAKTINGIAYNSPTCNGSTLTGIGRAQAAAIWYKALTTYMTSSTNYSAARVATVNAATSLYGASSTQVAAVKAAWSAVSVA